MNRATAPAQQLGAMTKNNNAMLYYDFGGYDGFKELFGLRECGNGEKARRNKILLSYVKQRELVRRAVAGDEEARFHLNVKSMDALWAVLREDLYEKSEGLYGWKPCGLRFYTERFMRDDYQGLCEDGDTRAIRYVNAENGRVFKMRAGKFLRKVCEDAKVGWPEPVLVWFCEEFAGRWQAYATGQIPAYELHVERSYDAFRKIYDRDEQVGDFHSCMNGRHYDSFYMDAVDAKAAWLTDKNGHMVARCVIFTEVQDEDTGEVLRLAERQYSSDCSELLKRILVDKLIAAGEIDGYKRVGADCCNSRAFVGNDGSDWSDRCFYIRCSLEPGGTVSYQDSFKWWTTGGDAYNYDSGFYDAELDTTGGRLNYGNYDSYHGCYTWNDVVEVYVGGRREECDAEDMDDFVYVDYGRYEGDYVHCDDVTYCVDIDAEVYNDDAIYSELLDEYYYDEYTMVEKEQEYKEENWVYSEWDEEWYEDEDDVVKMHFADGTEQTISKYSAERNFEFEVRDGEYYELVKQEEAA